MKCYGFALEQHFRDEIKNVMGYLDLARSERYRNLVILGLDEYAISGSELRKKKFPIKGKFIPFSVMLPPALNNEIEKVKKKRKQTKRLAIRYIILLGFEKWKRDNPHQVKNEDDKIDLDKSDTVNIPFDTKDMFDTKDIEKQEITTGIIKSNPDNLWQKSNVVIPSGSNDMTIGEKFQAVIDLVRELDLKITIEKK